MTWDSNEMSKGHSYHIKEVRWAEIKEKAWELSSKKGEMIKPTDLVDAALFKAIKELEYKDIEEAKNNR